MVDKGVIEMTMFTDVKQQILLSDINTIEKIVGLQFPEDYKNHLLKYNGGKCDPDSFDFVINEWNYDYDINDTESSVDRFLAIHNGKYDNLEEYIESLKIKTKRMPSHIIPVAHDSGGNLICISCGEDDYGCVYFWTLGTEVDYTEHGDDAYFNLYFIAESFTKFLDSLYVPDWKKEENAG